MFVVEAGASQKRSCYSKYADCSRNLPSAILNIIAETISNMATILIMIILFSMCLQAYVAYSVSVKIGTLLAFNTSIGMTAFSAMKLAIEDISRDTSLLNGIQLDLIAFDENCSAFQGAAAAMEMIGEEVVTMIGPQTSVVSHFVSHMATATQIPLVSFSATDPSLAEHQYPYFLRVAQSDSSQMEGIGSVIASFGWREVVAIYVDDDFGVNGINALADTLQGFGITIVFRAALDSSFTSNNIVDTLSEMLQLGSKIYVIHMHPNMAKMLLAKAYELNMMTSGFVWIVSEIIIYALDMDYHLDDITEGILGLRTCIPNSIQLYQLEKRLQKAMQSVYNASASINIYALWAYDSVWAVALAIDGFLKKHKNFTFELPPYTIPDNAGGNSSLARMKVLKEGPALLYELLRTNFSGLTGNISLGKKELNSGSCLEVVNMIGGKLNVIGRWLNRSIVAKSANGSKIMNVTWPGGSTHVPRGWMFPKNQKLTIGIPNKHGFKVFVDATPGSVSGFCIDVFAAAISNLSYAIDYEFKPFGDGKSTPSYDDLVTQLANKEYDAIVGDITITTKRSKIVDFTQPYATSGMVVVVPIKKANTNHAWAFMRPFTPGMWCTTGAFFLFTGVVIWLLEHKKNRQFRGRTKKQIVTTLWFSFSTLFFSQREDVKSTLGRAALIIWLFVVLIINSSYTASLTSILTWQQLTPNIQNIAGLIASNAQIGYQSGSFVEEYLEQLNVPKSRLVPLDSISAYAASLRKGSKAGGVGAIVDELPYVQLFLSSNCDYTIAGDAFTKSGWGFAFQKGSQLAVDLSRAILTLSEDGVLQHIHDKWLKEKECHNSNEDANSNQLGMGTFWGLFLITGTASIACLVIYYVRMFWRFQRAPPEQSLSRGKSTLRSFISFVEESQVRDSRESRRQSLQDDSVRSSALERSNSAMEELP